MLLTMKVAPWKSAGKRRPDGASSLRRLISAARDPRVRFHSTNYRHQEAFRRINSQTKVVLGLLNQTWFARGASVRVRVDFGELGQRLRYRLHDERHWHELGERAALYCACIGVEISSQMVDVSKVNGVSEEKIWDLERLGHGLRHGILCCCECDHLITRESRF